MTTTEQAPAQAGIGGEEETHVSMDELPAYIASLQERNAALVSRLAELERDRTDALRYRFLRDNGLRKALRARDAKFELAFGYPSDETVFKTGMGGGRTSLLIDTALDLAMTAAATPEGPRHE